MSAVIVQCTCLLAAIALPGVTCIACITGWFGDRCQYKCHCSESVYCRDDDGECPGIENCAAGYFGSGCQYVDLAYLHALPTTPRYLYDQDDRTCNNDSDATSVTIVLNENLPASSFRITGRDYTKMLLFTVAYNKVYPCLNEKRYVVSSFIVDVVCETGFTMREVTVRGEIASTICSIYINGGRNIALKQFVNQSSTYWRLSDAMNAVDGNRDSNFERGSCARTNSGLQQRWTIYFDRPVKMLRAVLYNSGDSQLHGFTIETYNGNGSLVRRHLDAYISPQPVYDVSLISQERIVKLQIVGTTDYPVKPNNLHFCEIEVFGDFWCGDTNYGLDCGRHCACPTFYHTCNQMHGVCTHTCVDGRYGASCNLQCGSTCLDRKCEPQSGVCYYCSSGSSGDFCTSANKATPDTGVSYLWSVVPIIMVMITTPVVIYMCLEQRRKRTQPTEPPAADEEPQPPHEEPQPPQKTDVDSEDGSGV